MAHVRSLLTAATVSTSLILTGAILLTVSTADFAYAGKGNGSSDKGGGADKGKKEKSKSAKSQSKKPNKNVTRSKATAATVDPVEEVLEAHPS